MKILRLLVILPSLMLAQIPGYVPTSSLLAWYSFNGNANDLSGNNHNGTVIGTTLTSDRFGNASSAYMFSNNNYISVPDNSISLRPQNVTISAWACYTAAPTWVHLLFAKNVGSGMPESIGLYYVNFNTFWSGNIGGPSFTGPTVDVPHSPSVAIWYHFVYSFDDVNDVQRIYLNGVLSATGAVTQSIGYDAQPWTFGCELENGSPNFFFTGKIDDIGIWSRTLTPTEVNNLYCSGGGAITGQPQSQTVTVGGTAVFAIVASSLTPSFQWQSDVGMGFQNLTNAGQFSGVNTATLTVSNLTISNNNQLFRCIASGSPCISTSNAATLTVNPSAGIREHQISEAPKLFPNPAFNRMVISLESVLTGAIDFEIVDVLGRAVMSGTIREQETTVSLAEIPAGLYFLNVEGKKSAKLIKQ
jgi:hypothetical protein